MSPATHTSQELEAALSLALELRDSGQEDWLSAACDGRPGLMREVQAAVGSADELPALIGNSAARDGLIGQRLGGRFELRERIGAGAMGVVYLAEDLELRRKVACKVVRHGLMAPEQALERFVREARAMAAVQHSSVITIHDRGRTQDDEVYIVMELVDGAALSDVIEASSRVERDDNGWLEARFGIATTGESSYLRTVVGWAADLAAGLEAVHAAGVLHRDIKPSNILVRRDGRPVLLDFGIALLEDHGTLTRGATSIGTPAYMPPEALEREGKRTPASDIYSLAATLYHMVTLRAPYEGTPTQVLTALATREPMPAAKLRPGLPRDLQAILDKGMHRRPSARYATAGALEADLRAFLEFRPIAARPVTRLERARRRFARSRLAQGAAATLLLVGALLGARAAHGAWITQRHAELAELSRHFPPNFPFVNPPNRTYRYDSDRAQVGALLDASVAVAVTPLPAQLLRALFRLDHGDPRGAASDMRAVADFVGTPFAAALAARYAAAPDDAHDYLAIDVADLPEVSSPLDRYLEVVHMLREGDPELEAEALQLLEAPELRAIPHAEELRLAFTPFLGLSPREASARAAERYTDLVALEARMGRGTAATAHIAGRLLGVQGRFAEAREACARGLTLCERSHVLCINAGHAALGLGRLDEARAHLTLAIDLKPTYAHPVDNLIWVELAARDFGRARALAEEAAPRVAPDWPEWRESWLGVIASYAALDASQRGAEREVADLVAAALQHFERAGITARGPSEPIEPVEPGQEPSEAPEPEEPSEGELLIEVIRALRAQDHQTKIAALIDLLRRDPQNWWRRDLVRSLMPETLEQRATDAIRHLMDSEPR
ncbi:MAG: serine/threonine-protein kinase [Planctomycetota bacterium]